MTGVTVRSYSRAIKIAISLILATGFISVTGSLTADTLVLKNGLRIYGKVIQQSTTHLTIRTPRGRKTLRKKYVRAIQYGSYEEAMKKRLAARRKARAARRRRALAARRKREAARRAAQAAERARLAAEKEEIRKRELARLRLENERKLKEEREKEEREALLALARERAERLKLMRQAVREGGMDKPDEPIEYWDFAWRSLVLPGWGHLAIGQKVPGYFYSITTGVGLIWISQTRSAALSAKNNNRSQIELWGAAVLSPAGLAATTQEQRNTLSAALYTQRRTSYDDRINAYNRGVTLLAVAYGLQFLHIIYDGFRWERGELITDDDRNDVSASSRWSGDIFPEVVSSGTDTGGLQSTRTGVRANISYHFVF